MIKNFTVKVNNIPLERVIKHKSFGVEIDETLNWYGHTLLLFAPSKKIFTGLAILKRVSPILPFDTRVDVHDTLVMPNLITVVLYGIISIKD